MNSVLLSAMLLVSCLACFVDAAVAAQPDRMEVTQLAIEYCCRQVKLIEQETLLQSRHPGLKQYQQRAKALRREIRRMIANGSDVDVQVVNRSLDRLGRECEWKRNVATGVMTDSHPRLALMELRLRAIQHVRSTWLESLR